VIDFGTKHLVHHFKDAHQGKKEHEGKIIVLIEGKNAIGIITSLTVSKNDKYLISAATDKSIKIFDLQTMLQLHHFKDICPCRFIHYN